MGHSVTRIETISNGLVDERRVGYTSDLLDDRDPNWLVPGELLFSHINSPERVGHVALYEGHPQKLFHGINLLRLRPAESLLDPHFALHLLRSEVFRSKLRPFVNQAVNQASVSATNLKSIAVPLPPLEEQRRIASILDAADALRTKRRQALAKLDTLAQAIFIDMFGDPLHLSRGGSEPTSESKLGELARVRTGKLDANASSEDGIYPFFTCASEPLRIDVSAFECNAILVAGNGDLNVKYFEGKFNAYQRTYVIDSLDESRAHPRFLHGFLDIYVGRLREQAIGGVIRYIKLGMLTEAVVQLPSQHAQSVYVRTIEAVDAARSLAEHSEKQADALFTALQYRAFRGEL